MGIIRAIQDRRIFFKVNIINAVKYFINIRLFFLENITIEL